jgi:hypothetical protein
MMVDPKIHRLTSSNKHQDQAQVGVETPAPTPTLITKKTIDKKIKIKPKIAVVLSTMSTSS